MSKFIHSSGYYFMALPEHTLSSFKAKLMSIVQPLQIKGTILLSPEGINIAIAGIEKHVNFFKTEIKALFNIDCLEYRDTHSDILPFQKFLITCKQQIIPFPDQDLPLKKNTAPYVSAEKLHDWLEHKKEMVLLDVRNQYEIVAGSFQNKIELQLANFRDFPQKTYPLRSMIQSQPIVTFCTGGIRCEKAAGSLLQQGFTEVYQLKGGILNYFEHYGSQYYEGGCFVFDDRAVIYPT